MFGGIRLWWQKRELWRRLNGVKKSVDDKLQYEPYKKRDFRVAFEGKGNCAVFACTYAHVLGLKGYNGAVVYYGKLKTGEEHAVCLLPTEYGPMCFDVLLNFVAPHDESRWSKLYLWTGEVK